MEKIRLASEQFKKEKLSDYYNTETFWLALVGLFDALLDSVTGDGSIDRATDGRITEESIIGLPQEILADGCDSDPADDGPEVRLMRRIRKPSKVEPTYEWQALYRGVWYDVTAQQLNAGLIKCTEYRRKTARSKN